MQVVASIEALTRALADWRDNGARLALVPTMGNLHAGHLALVQRGLETADIVVVTIFVNPMQFGANEDLDAYPRTLDADIDKLEQAGAQLLFAPAVSEIYPEGVASHTQVRVPGLTDVLCGASRPGHFDGVTSIVCKLLNLVAPDVALFGEKDLQQLLIIRKMVRDLALPVRIEGVATARADDGLALSSRNGYLSPLEREAAAGLQHVLRNVGEAIHGGRRDYTALAAEANNQLVRAGFDPDYVEVRRLPDLAPATNEDAEIAVFAAARMGSTRLIDNLQLQLKAPPAS